ncbi:DUF6880 family protein [Marivita sp.]|uniref:DUF6880 family protein n=1 Tax=Marivita sp. TaxID=2003365 RepID=UPI003B52A011
MSKKTLNKQNLERLGAEKLAELVMELVQGSAGLQRRARMELSAAQGPKEIAADVRKRLVSLRRSKSWVNWRKQRALIKELDALLDMIENKIAPHDANEAFELAWMFLSVAPALYERTDDSNGSIGDEMSFAVRLIEKIAPEVQLDAEALAERILDAVVAAGYGEFDGIMPATAPILGDTGLEHLKKITKTWAETPPEEHELERYRSWGIGSTTPEEIVQQNRKGTSSVILADIADAQGDVDAYMARYSDEQLTYGTIAPDVARRLLDAGRVEEAMQIVLNCREAEKSGSYRMFRYDLDAVYEECLEKLGQTEELKQHLWDTFTNTLMESALRKYLKLLPDFDDIEAEERALDFAEQYPYLSTAVSFLLKWPAPARAAKLIEARADELDGNSYYTMTEAAEALAAEYPLAATLMLRSMIQDTLNGAKHKRYRYAAKHLAECAASDVAITDYGSFPSHDQFMQALKEHHSRKHGFWGLVEQ